MNSDILFISDLHIAIEKPEITQRFLLFLTSRATKAKALYILGDLFDVWIGDDDQTPPLNKIRRHLKQLTASGISVFLQPGNRDFLLGQEFCHATGVQLLGDYVVIDLFGTPTLLTHGDLLCTDDLAYQAFRVKSHSPEWRQSVLAKPLLIRLLAARWYRFRSFLHKRKKSQEIMDVNASTVVDVMQRYGCFRLVHGHTHRPAVHNFEINGQAAQRFVLADWTKDEGKILCWHKNGYRIEII
jgi:UDP-2,3-diacylglucosamine hydrolase